MSHGCLEWFLDVLSFTLPEKYVVIWGRTSHLTYLIMSANSTVSSHPWIQTDVLIITLVILFFSGSWALQVREIENYVFLFPQCQNLLYNN